MLHYDDDDDDDNDNDDDDDIYVREREKKERKRERERERERLFYIQHILSFHVQWVFSFKLLVCLDRTAQKGLTD